MTDAPKKRSKWWYVGGAILSFWIVGKITQHDQPTSSQPTKTSVASHTVDAAPVDPGCGAKPDVSRWGDQRYVLQEILKKTANDPDSIEVSECSDPFKLTDLCWTFFCNVRGKNVYGAKILARKAFNVKNNELFEADEQHIAHLVMAERIVREMGDAGAPPKKRHTKKAATDE